MRSNRWALAVLAASFAVLAAGIAHLLMLRFKEGDTYPPYSSLRADPLGAKAFHDSLSNLADLEVSRNYRAFPRFPDNRRTTLFLLGVPTQALVDVEEADVRELEGLVMEGGRLVLAFLPESKEALKRDQAKEPPDRKPSDPPRPRSRKGKAPGDPEPREPRRGDGAKDRPTKKRYVSLMERWGLGFAPVELPTAPDGSHSMNALWNDPLDGRAQVLSWHTALVFEKLNPAWRALAKRESRPVIVERKLGNGSVVFCADSYLFSNEALTIEPHPAVLAYLVGNSTRIVFDEAHLGIEESQGIASLARKYRLHGLVAGLVLLALLFTWKNAVSLVPRQDEDTEERLHSVARGKDAAAGLVNLLRRNIRAGDVLNVCLGEWKATLGHVRKMPPEDLMRIEQLLSAEQQRPLHGRDPVSAYNAIARILAERKFQWIKQPPTS